MTAATTLADLDAQTDQYDTGADLRIHATAIEHFGRELAQELQRSIADPAKADPLKPVLLAVPAVHVRALLRAAEKVDDEGSPRGAMHLLVEAMHRAFDADRVDEVANALGFVLVAYQQHTAATALNALLAIAPELPRRERRQRHVELVEQLERAIDWGALAVVS